LAEIRVRKSVSIEASTVGDVAKWLAAIESEPGIGTATQLLEPVHLTVDTAAE
jgi:hypothetical protein